MRQDPRPPSGHQVGAQRAGSLTPGPDASFPERRQAQRSQPSAPMSADQSPPPRIPALTWPSHRGMYQPLIMDLGPCNYCSRQSSFGFGSFLPHSSHGTLTVSTPTPCAGFCVISQPISGLGQCCLAVSGAAQPLLRFRLGSQPQLLLFPFILCLLSQVSPLQLGVVWEMLPSIVTPEPFGLNSKGGRQSSWVPGPSLPRLGSKQPGGLVRGCPLWGEIWCNCLLEGQAHSQLLGSTLPWCESPTCGPVARGRLFSCSC